MNCSNEAIQVIENTGQVAVMVAGEINHGAVVQNRHGRLVIMGDEVRRLFLIWNRGYKVISVIAEGAPEALQIAATARHLKRPQHFRKYEDVTDKALTHVSDEFGSPEALETALNFGRSGVATLGDDGVWKIDGTATA